MKTFGLSLTALAFVSAAFLLYRYPPDTANAPQNSELPVRPVLVELFTSEGCSSCPPADALLAKLDREARMGNPEIIALEEHVDYWDSLGWRDPYSSVHLTERQQDYAASFRNEGVYTPQMVVDGRTEFVGSSQNRAKSAIADAAREPKAEVVLRRVVTAGDGQAKIAVEVKMLPVGEIREAQVWLAVTENELHSNVLHGENAGQDLHHDAVVRSLRKVGNAAANRETAFASEQDVHFDSGWKKENLRVVVFVQDPKSKRIVGAAALRLQP